MISALRAIRPVPWLASLASAQATTTAPTLAVSMDASGAPVASASTAAPNPDGHTAATGCSRGALLLKRLAEAQRTAKQARALVKLARKQGARGARVGFARGVQAERGVSKQAQKAKAKRRSKKERKGQEAVRRRKKARRKKVAAVQGRS